jgi:GH15 family glucan-1,4-alpha-glucosidase
LSLAADGEAPSDHADHWRSESARIRAWIDERCWSDDVQSYTIHPGTDELDASLLLAVRIGYLPPDDPRLHMTVDAIRTGLDAGAPLLYRYSGRRGQEGAFVACSFWLAEAYARLGRLDEARTTMDSLMAFANDVGLYSEEIDPRTGSFLGNFPQALTHLSLINAAQAIQRAEEAQGS